MHDWESRIRHVESTLNDFGDALRRLADQVGQNQQNQMMQRMPPGFGRPARSVMAAVTTAGGIGVAPDANTLGSGTIILRIRNGSALTDGPTATCYSNFEVAITHPTRLVVAPYGVDDWILVGAQDCPPE